jgi:hypothetical protein
MYEITHFAYYINICGCVCDNVIISVSTTSGHPFAASLIQLTSMVSYNAYIFFSGSCEHVDEPSGSLKSLGISWMAAQLAASQEGLTPYISK